MTRTIGLVLLLGLLLATATAALAGGWALVSLDAPPGDIHAGEPWTVTFTVLQHGKTPTHGFDGNPLSPTLIATNPATGERVEVEATPLEEIGRYTLEATFPSAGAWEWTIEPRPFIGETVFEPLNVLPAAALAAAAASEPDGATLSALLRWAAVGVAAVAVGLALFYARRRAPVPALPEA